MKALWPLALFFALFPGTLSAAQMEYTRVPIEYSGVRVSVEMPTAWAIAPFPIQPMPANPKARMQRMNRYTLWTKDWAWNRSWFRGPLGHIIFDAFLSTEPRETGNRESANAMPKANFLNPADLLTYRETATRGSFGAEFSRYSLVNRDGVVWVRCHQEDAIFSGIPTAESWFLGLTDDLYLQFDFAAIRDSKEPVGERWLEIALYRQNRMIKSFEVTGLKQIVSGRESVVSWEMPSHLRENPPPSK